MLAPGFYSHLGSTGQFNATAGPPISMPFDGGLSSV